MVIVVISRHILCNLPPSVGTFISHLHAKETMLISVEALVQATEMKICKTFTLDDLRAYCADKRQGLERLSSVRPMFPVTSANLT